MAAGFGNTAAVAHANYAFLTTTTARQVTTMPGWTAAVGDITPIGLADGNLRAKVVSGRHDQQPIVVEFLMDMDATTAPGATTNTGNLTITSNGTTNTWVMSAGMTRFEYGAVLDDDVMIGTCEFVPLGSAAGTALDDWQ